MEGSALRAVKRGLIDQLTAVPNRSYQSPANAEDMIGQDGSGVAVWWDDRSESEIEMAVSTGGPHWFDERVTATLIVQVLGVDTADDQEACDTIATATLGEVVAVLAHDPSLGLTDTSELILFHVIPAAWRNVTGPLGTNLRAGRYELDVLIHARIMLNTS